MKDEQGGVNTSAEQQRHVEQPTRPHSSPDTRHSSPDSTHHSSLITRHSSLPALLEHGITASLFLLALCAPHTIAGTQGAWGLALLLWALRLALRPRPALRRTPVDYALLGFIALTFVSSLFSYDPDVSIAKLRAVSLFTIVYVVAQNVRSARVLRALVVALVASCVVNTFYTFGKLAVGRGVKVESLAEDSPLRAAGVREGDTLLKADGRALRGPEDLDALLSAPPGGADASSDSNRGAGASVRVYVYRLEWFYEFELPRASLGGGETAAARLGVTSWTRGRDERATGFYGHYTTYAEVLQLVASLALGLLFALGRRRNLRGALLAICVALFVAALVLTVTRASWLGLLVSSFVITLAGANRRALLLTAAVALPVVLAGLFVLQQKRQVGFIDPKEGSTAWRLTVWREGLVMLAASPRHALVGVGMDSLKRHWREWGMFDGGRLPWGHLHSTPLQIAFERGLPALLAWLALVAVYARMLWRLARREASLNWVERGLALGALGGTAGFFTSGLVHYNLGDSEVVMVFYLVMGLALALERLTRETTRASVALD